MICILMHYIRYGNMFLWYTNIGLIYCMGKFKIWEILLFVVVILLGAIAYESHKANKKGRYIMVGSPWELLDTQTGDFWTRRYPIETIIGDDTSDVYQWKLFNRGPYNTKTDTVVRGNYTKKKIVR